MDYLARLARKTQRDDDQLLRKYGPLIVDDHTSYRALLALRDEWAEKFDEYDIARDAPHSERLFKALRFVEPRPTRRISGAPHLTSRNERDIWRWLLSVRDRDIYGLKLVRDPGGWCDVVIAR